MRLSQTFLATAMALGNMASLGLAQCPFAAGSARLQGRNAHDDDTSRSFIQGHDVVDGENDWMTSDVGGPFTEQRSLKAGRRGPTLLEDFAFRQKMMHFDHERVSVPMAEQSTKGVRGLTRSHRYRNVSSTPAAPEPTVPLQATETSAI